jgi:hypothetical protein
MAYRYDEQQQGFQAIRHAFILVLLLAHSSVVGNAWMFPSVVRHCKPMYMSTEDQAAQETFHEEEVVPFDSLIDMDVVIYSRKDGGSSSSDNKKYFGAVQEDGRLAPLSAWTTEPAFGTSIEFLVDEEDRFSLHDIINTVKIEYLLHESELSYGSRQCHRGVGNPHGEESELLYYVDENVISNFRVEVPIKPDLEILW